jgi:hypothetical protein
MTRMISCPERSAAMKEVYEQVLITCTTINVVIVLSTLFSWIGIKISDHRRKKKETEKRKQDNNK